MGKAYRTHREKKNGYRVLVEKPEGRRLQEISRHTWKDNIKVDLKVVGSDVMDWIAAVP
jgi:hypothetical protein